MAENVRGQNTDGQSRKSGRAASPGGHRTNTESPRESTHRSTMEKTSKSNRNSNLRSRLNFFDSYYDGRLSDE